MSERVLRQMTPEEFFEWQKRQDKNYELVDGVPVLPLKSTVGATERHDIVTVNALGMLFNQLRGRPCRPRTQDKAIRLPNGRIRRPDLLVECGSPPLESMEADEPRLVVEVLSPSTMRYDRFQKLEEYKTHPAIRVILLIDTEAPQLTVWRGEGGSWARAELQGLEATVDLPEIGAKLPLAEIYDSLTFEPA
ncbi:MAG TPA: Uma2 family endonuclease [Afifellaceae bacterium]|nr:Uma2 family endonuclease [Afifellaceae bacterium]